MTRYSVYSDQELLRLLKESDNRAFTEIYDRYHQLLILYAHKKLQDKAAAQDIVQDVFVTLWEKRHELDINSHLPGYLYQAVRNRALNIFVRQKVNNNYLQSLGEFLDKSPDEADFIIREKDIVQAMNDEIALMPPKMRIVFEMSRNKYLSHKEIALELGISEETVNKHIKKALRKLKIKFGLWTIFL